MPRTAGAQVARPALAAVAAHTSAPAVPRVLAEIARDLQPDGVALSTTPDTSICFCRRRAT